MTDAAKRPDWSSLLQVAYSQGGYFRLVQASRAGVSRQLLRKHLLNGKLKRPLRGVYRLADVPIGEQDELLEMWLWSGGIGVFSHDTALQLHGLSDVLPTRIHMTLPGRLRRGDVPGILALHNADLGPADRVRIGSVPVTSVARTLRDAIDDHLDPDLIAQAVAEATARKLLARSDLRGIAPARRTRAGERGGVTS